jgi:hypothetical protein
MAEQFSAPKDDDELCTTGDAPNMIEIISDGAKACARA